MFTTSTGSGSIQIDSISGTPQCFAVGTLIQTPTGAVAVEDLAPGALVSTAEGRDVPILWVGEQSFETRHGIPMERRPVRIAAGALGDSLPERDLVVTGDHALALHGALVTASALIGLPGIDRVPMADLPDRFTVYHVETDAHELLLAEGIAAESFVDYARRARFDNFEGYVETHGAERLILERPEPRISSPRMQPAALKAWLHAAASDPGQADAA